jgi:membrane-bound lytic murein transglycosylase D
MVAPMIAPPSSTPTAEPHATRPADSTHIADSAKVAQAGKRAADLFGDSVTVDATPDPSAPSWDIDVHSYESEARVEHYVKYFSGAAKERIESRLERGTRYEPMIRAQMRAGGLPEDMYYLALVESGFDQNAYSRAAAVGMWQFMTSTARDMGLRVDWWVDERRDPVRSTGAAVRFIKGLRDQFGSLYLAAAAYNGGPVRVARGLSRYANALEGTSGDDLFFALAEKDYLRNETREYVPQLIAAALIAKEPARYGMKIEAQAPLVYDSVTVGPATPVAAIAHAAGTTVTTILDLNAELLRGITPPKDSFIVRVPASAADTFDAAFARLPKSEKLGLRTVTSKKGESIRSIATREGISTHQLSLYNPKLKLLKSGNLAPGQSVLVPTVAVASAATAVPDPSIERYGSSRGTTTHVVRSGETLGSIAKKYHTTTAQLMKTNGLKKALIFPGQSLVVGGTAKTAKKSAPSKDGAARGR